MQLTPSWMSMRGSIHLQCLCARLGFRNNLDAANLDVACTAGQCSTPQLIPLFLPSSHHPYSLRRQIRGRSSAGAHTIPHYNLLQGIVPELVQASKHIPSDEQLIHKGVRVNSLMQFSPKTHPSAMNPRNLDAGRITLLSISPWIGLSRSRAAQLGVSSSASDLETLAPGSPVIIVQ